MRTFVLLLIITICYCQSPVGSVGAGCALEFGELNSMEILNSSIYDGLSEFTAELWIRPFALTGSWDGHFSMWNNNTVRRSWWAGFQSTTGELELWISEDGVNYYAYQVPANNIVNGKWHHIAYVFKGGQYMKIYINGIEIPGNYFGNATTFPLFCADVNERLFIGRDLVANAWGINSQIDEVRIWNYARTEAEIRKDMCRRLAGTEPGLIGYWRFDECAGNVVYDASPNGSNATLY